MLYEYLAEVLAQHTGITMMAPIPTNFRSKVYAWYLPQTAS